QPANSAGSRPRCASGAAGHHRRGDRMTVQLVSRASLAGEASPQARSLPTSVARLESREDALGEADPGCRFAPAGLRLADAMRRREFATLLSSAAASFVSWPLAARAQQRQPVIGYLSVGAPGTYAGAEFHQGLNEMGYVEGRNVAIEYHWAGGRFDYLPILAA